MNQELIGINVYWTKNGSDEQKVTFIMALNHEDAWNKVFKMKGGSANITIIKSQCYDRVEKCSVGDAVFYPNTPTPTCI